MRPNDAISLCAKSVRNRSLHWTLARPVVRGGARDRHRPDRGTDRNDGAIGARDDAAHTGGYHGNPRDRGRVPDAPERRRQLRPCQGFTGSLATRSSYRSATASQALELSIILALIVPTALAFLLGLVIVRIPGIAFSMLTLAVGQAFFEFAMKARQVTGGEDGLSINLPAQIFGMPAAWFQNPHSMLMISWGVLTLIVLGLWCVAESSFGRLTMAIRRGERGTRPLHRLRDGACPRGLVGQPEAAFIVPVASDVLPLYNIFVSPNILHWSLSGSALIMAIIGGPRMNLGPNVRCHCLLLRQRPGWRRDRAFGRPSSASSSSP